MALARMGHNAFLIGGFALWVFLVLPGTTDILEANLPSHFLVQLPLLALVGWLLGCDPRIGRVFRTADWNRYGITGLVLALLALLFWMIPRSLDASLIDGRMAVAKYFSFPLLVGLPLRLSWPAAPFFVKGFLQANLLSMIVFLAWLYHAAPVQLCNSYLREDQLLLSQFLIKIFFVLSVIFAFKPIFGFSPTRILSRVSEQFGQHLVRYQDGHS